jgi:hypothetical protein
MSLRDVIDVHAHSAPDVVPRSQTDLQLVRACTEAGMAGVVLKNHHSPTTARAALAEEAVGGGIRVFGGVVLNSGATGGLNPDAVDVNLRMGARVIWLPTVSAPHHQGFLARGSGDSHVGALSAGARPVPVLGDDGEVLPSLTEILGLIAGADAVLASGHLSPEETLKVFERARELGVTRLLVNHVEAPVTDMDVAAQRKLAELGAYLEHCHLSILTGHPARQLIDGIREVGLDHAVLSTDLGQAAHVPPAQGYADLHDRLREAGLTAAEWERLACANPARLLGLDTTREREK